MWKLSDVHFYVYARHFIHCLYFIYARKIYERTHLKNYPAVEIHPMACPTIETYYNRLAIFWTVSLDLIHLISVATMVAFTLLYVMRRRHNALSNSKRSFIQKKKIFISFS